jgi:hypothetical protein
MMIQLIGCKKKDFRENVSLIKKFLDKFLITQMRGGETKTIIITKIIKVILCFLMYVKKSTKYRRGASAKYQQDWQKF